MTPVVDTWMPLYVADYLANTNHLSTAEHGAYLLLMMQAWRNGGALPIESERLRRIARMDAKAWRNAQDVILERFYVHEDRELRHRGIDENLRQILGASAVFGGGQ